VSSQPAFRRVELRGSIRRPRYRKWRPSVELDVLDHLNFNSRKIAAMRALLFVEHAALAW